jgi:hypothetical protein
MLKAKPIQTLQIGEKTNAGFTKTKDNTIHKLGDTTATIS